MKEKCKILKQYSILNILNNYIAYKLIISLCIRLCYVLDMKNLEGKQELEYIFVQI